MQIVTESTFLNAAKKVGAVSAQHATDADAARRLPREVVDAVLDAGFARYFVPRQWGGSLGGFAELTDGVALVGEGCTSAAWIAALYAHSARFGAYLPTEGQAEVWANGPDAAVVSALVPSGRVQPVADGWRLAGEWSYISGVDVSDWAMVCGPSPTGGDDVEQMFFAIPVSDYSVRDTWMSVGMRATMSNTLVVEDAFVPRHRAFPRWAVSNGVDDPEWPPCHRVPLRAVSGLTFGAPVLGAATGALRSSIDMLTAKRDVRGRPSKEKPAIQLALARADGEIEAARLLLHRVAEICDEGIFTPERTARNGRDSAMAVELLTSAVDRLFRAGGTGGQTGDRPLQRFWRDVNCAGTHVALGFDTPATEYARFLLEHAA